jgi:hypothetical protein
MLDAKVVRRLDVHRTQTWTHQMSKAPANIRRTVCRPPLNPAVGSGRWHGGRLGGRPRRPLVGDYVQRSGCGQLLHPAVGVVVGQLSARPTARPSARYKTIVKPLQN